MKNNGTHLVATPSPLNAGLVMRVRSCESFIQRAVRRFRNMGHNTIKFNIQLHDEEPKKPSFLIDAAAKEDARHLPMIQDFYCLESAGYKILGDSFQKLPTWNERLPIAIWRGSTTGGEMLTTGKIKTLNRYRLCIITPDQGGILDARFNTIVQAASSGAKESIEDHLRQLDLLRPRMAPNLMALHKWIIDIDGNVNSWGLLWKFLSGSCILRVESKRRQWFYNELSPWYTHVPISEDLHDLPEKLLWCRRNPRESEEIAQRGQRMAQNVVARISRDQDRAIDIYAKKYL